MEVGLKVPDDELLQPGEPPGGGGQVVLAKGSRDLTVGVVAVQVPGHSGLLFPVVLKESQSWPSPRISLSSSGAARDEIPGC